MNINIAMCDDDDTFLRRFQKILSSMDWNNKQITVDMFISGKELLEKIKNGIKYDIIFMDIEFEDGYLGMDTAMVVKMILPSSLIVYVSAYNSYFGDLVKAEPFYFLKKDVHGVDSEELQKSIDMALDRLHFLHESFLYSYKFNGINNVVNLNDVLYFESVHRVIVIHMNNNSIFQFYKKLDDVEYEIEKITPYFIRVNQSFLINRKYINLENSTTVSVDGVQVKISSKYADSFMAKYLKFVHAFR